MKTSIFDMSFTLPPMIEMAQVEKEMPTHTGAKHNNPRIFFCANGCI